MHKQLLCQIMTGKKKKKSKRVGLKLQTRKRCQEEESERLAGGSRKRFGT